jgi:hypothetical protein
MMGAEDNAELAKLNADYGIESERASRLVQAEKKKWLAGTLVGLIQVSEGIRPPVRRYTLLAYPTHALTDTPTTNSTGAPERYGPDDPQAAQHGGRAGHRPERGRAGADGGQPRVPLHQGGALLACLLAQCCLVARTLVQCRKEIQTPKQISIEHDRHDPHTTRWRGYWRLGRRTAMAKR